MRRRILKPRPDAAVDEAHDADAVEQRPDTFAGTGATAGDPGEQWEDWEESESERVARWLRGKVRPDLEVVDDTAPREHSAYDLDVVHLEDTQAARDAASRAETEVWRLDQERRRLATEVEAERAQAERARREQLDAWARLEQEMSELDQRRRRLAEAVEAERQEVERVRQEQLEARARLESAVAELDQQRHRLTAMEAERSQAELARQEHADARAALAAEVAAIDEQRQRLMAAVETERSETERARRAHVDARSRLESEMSELDVQRRRLVEAVEAERAEAERARLEQLEAKARLEAEVAELDRERQRLLASMEADRAEAAEASAAETADAGDDGDAAGDDAPGPAGAGGPGSATGRHPRGAGATARSRRRRLAAAQVDPSARAAVVRLARPPAAENAEEAPERNLSLVEQREHEQEQARARLADAVAELARHVATMQSAERTEAEWTRHWELEAKAREAEAEAAAAERRRRAALEAARVDATRRRRWLLWAVLAVAVLTPLAVDVASLMAARSRLAGVAEDAALSAAADLSQQGDGERARRVAQAAADTEGVVLEEFAVDAGDVRVVVRDEASSLVLGRLAPTKDWYDVTATAAASAAGAAPGG